MRIRIGPRGRKPSQSISGRRLAAAIGLALLGIPALVVAGAFYSDVPETHPFRSDIDAITQAGLTNGCGGGKYCPDSPVTRGQVARFLNRLGALGPGTEPVVNADRLDGLDSTEFMPATATFMPAETYVTFVEDVFLAGEFDITGAFCDEGDQLLSGGYFDVNGVTTHVLDSFPHPAGHWEVGVVNTGLEDDAVAIYAMCADFAPLHVDEPGLQSEPRRDSDG